MRIFHDIENQTLKNIGQWSLSVTYDLQEFIIIWRMTSNMNSNLPHKEDKEEEDKNTFTEFASGSTIHGLNKLVDKNCRIYQR